MRNALVLAGAMALSSGTGAAEIQAVPASLRLAGEAGEAVKRLLQVSVSEEVADVTLTAGVLRHAEDASAWLDGVTITPGSSAKLSPGDLPLDVVVEVVGPAVAGTYGGTLQIAGTASGGGRQTLEVPLALTVTAPDFGLLVDGRRVAGQDLTVVGLVGDGPLALRADFSLSATRKVTGIEFEASDLEATSDSLWIAAASVTPSGPAELEPGEAAAVAVTVSGVAAPGLYRGALEIAHAGGSETLGLTVEALELTPSPEEIEVAFERPGWFGRGGRGAVEVPLELVRQEQRASSLGDSLSSELRVSLGPLRQEDEKSKVLRLQAPWDGKRSGVDGDALELVLTPSRPAPEAPAGVLAEPGAYSGTLRLTHPKLGLVAAIPVEANVKSSEWQAWLLMAMGVLISWLISYWHTTGKARNAVRGSLARLQARLQAAKLTRAGRRGIEALIAQGYDQLEAGQVSAAQTHVGTIDSALTAAVDVKVSLDAKLEEVLALAGPIESLERLLAESYGGGQPVFGYLRGLQSRVERLREEIESERFATAGDEALTESYTAIATAQTQLASVAAQIRRAGAELDRVAAIFQEAFPDKAPIRGDLRDAFLRDASENLGQAADGDAVASLAAEMARVAGRVASVDVAVRRLRFFQERIRDHIEAGSEMTESTTAVAAHLIDLRNGGVPAPTKLDELAGLIKADLTATSQPEAELKLELAPVSSQRHDPEVARRVLGRATVETAAKDDRARPPEDETRVPGWRRRWRKARRAVFDPRRTERYVTLLLWAVALGITLPIGMNQTYFNDDTFGGVMAYLAVFLWGFGIQTGTATAANVLSKIRGTQ